MDAFVRRPGEGVPGGFTVDGFLRLIQLFIDKKQVRPSERLARGRGPVGWVPRGVGTPWSGGPVGVENGGEVQSRRALKTSLGLHRPCFAGWPRGGWVAFGTIGRSGREVFWLVRCP